MRILSNHFIDKYSIPDCSELFGSVIQDFVLILVSVKLKKYLIELMFQIIHRGITGKFIFGFN